MWTSCCGKKAPPWFILHSACTDLLSWDTPCTLHRSDSLLKWCRAHNSFYSLSGQLLAAPERSPQPLQHLRAACCLLRLTLPHSGRFQTLIWASLCRLFSTRWKNSWRSGAEGRSRAARRGVPLHQGHILLLWRKQESASCVLRKDSCICAENDEAKRNLTQTSAAVEQTEQQPCAPQRHRLLTPPWRTQNAKKFEGSFPFQEGNPRQVHGEIRPSVYSTVFWSPFPLSHFTDSKSNTWGNHRRSCSGLLGHTCARSLSLSLPLFLIQLSTLPPKIPTVEFK